MTIHIPLPLQDKRIRFIKLHKETKLPTELGWQLCEEDWDRQENGSWKNKRDGHIHSVKIKGNKKIYKGEKNNYEFDDTKFVNWVSAGNAYGILCGVASKGLIIADEDKLMPETNNLPKTFREHNDKHIYYFCLEIKQEIGLNKDGAHYGEIKSTGRQTKVYEDNNGFEIATINKKELLEVLKKYVSSDGDFKRNVDTKPLPKLLFKDSVPCQAVQNMINQGAPTDYRNPTANKIVQQLRGYCGFSKARCLECLKIFNNNCNPSKELSVIESDLDKQFDNYGYVAMNCNTYSDFCPFKNDRSKCPKSEIVMSESRERNISQESIDIIDDLPQVKETTPKIIEKKKSTLKAAYERIAKLRGEKNG